MDSELPRNPSRVGNCTAFASMPRPVSAQWRLITQSWSSLQSSGDDGRESFIILTVVRMGQQRPETDGKSRGIRARPDRAKYANRHGAVNITILLWRLAEHEHNCIILIIILLTLITIDIDAEMSEEKGKEEECKCRRRQRGIAIRLCGFGLVIHH